MTAAAISIQPGWCPRVAQRLPRAPSRKVPPTSRPVARLASGSNHSAAAIKASPPRNQTIVLKWSEQRHHPSDRGGCPPVALEKRLDRPHHEPLGQDAVNHGGSGADRSRQPQGSVLPIHDHTPLYGRYGRWIGRRQYTCVWWRHDRSPDQGRLDNARPADAGERRRQRAEGRPDGHPAKGVARQLLLALPGYRRFPRPALAELAGALDRPGDSRPRRQAGRTGPPEDLHEAGLCRQARPRPGRAVVGRRRSRMLPGSSPPSMPAGSPTSQRCWSARAWRARRPLPGPPSCIGPISASPSSWIPAIRRSRTRPSTISATCSSGERPAPVFRGAAVPVPGGSRLLPPVVCPPRSCPPAGGGRALSS